MTTEETIRLEQFCAQYAFGVPLTEALRTAEYEVTTAAFGYSLLKTPKAQALVDEHRKWLRSKVRDDIDVIAAQLDRDREFAYASNNPAAAGAATMNKAKLLGLLDPTREINGKKYVFAWAQEIADG